VQKVDITAGKEMRVSHSNYRVSLTRIVGKSLAKPVVGVLSLIAEV
jgi:hypothetical protein